MFKKFFSGRNLEKEVFLSVEKYLNIFSKSVKCLHNLLVAQDMEKSFCIDQLEREADSIKRNILLKIYEGAFLPYLRPNLFLFIDTVEKGFDFIKHSSFELQYIITTSIYDNIIKEKCIQINLLNQEMSELLLLSFKEFSKRNNLRETLLAIRMLEKKIDDAKLELTSYLRNKEVKNYWEGESLSRFVTYLTSISDIIEDAGDQLTILDLCLP